jgi:imidazoleglycerol-phosphate dehydratase
MKARSAIADRKTKETHIHIELTLDGSGKIKKISSGIPFFDHMLALFAIHGFFDLTVGAKGDIEIDYHHTIEDLGLVLGDAVNDALGDRKGIHRYGFAVTPMDEALTSVTVDLSNRPFLVYNVPEVLLQSGNSLTCLTKEFFRAFATRSGMNLHINVSYGENEHHVLESIFKAVGRAMDKATSLDNRISNVRSSKGIL